MSRICSRRWEKREMQVGKLVGMTFGALLLLSAIAVPKSQEQQAPQPVPQQPAAAAQAPTAEQAPSQSTPQGPARRHRTHPRLNHMAPLPCG